MPKAPEQLRRANETLALLRRQIVQGRFAPGQQLPTRREFLEELGVSPVTLQRALDRLTAEGFVQSKGRGGTFVMNNPPHLSRIAFVFSQMPSNDITQWSVFSRLLAAEAPGLADRHSRKISLYYGIDGHADNEDFQALVRDVHARRVAGLLFGHSPWLLKGTPLLDEPGVPPRVAITSKLHVHPAVESVSPNWDSFFERAMDDFASHGRKRIALILKPNMLEDWGKTIDRKMSELGLETRPYWQLVLASPLSVRNCLHLLLNSNQIDRPDGLLICDDGWTQHAVAGLVAAGVRVPEDVHVVAHSNFPASAARVLPFRRLGWEASLFLETALERLNSQRDTGKLGDGVRLPAVFDDEIEDYASSNLAGEGH